jgi:hypothetical protein
VTTVPRGRLPWRRGRSLTAEGEPCCQPEQRRHCWASEFTFGDTCECGRFYLLTDGEGRFVVEEREPDATAT